jgi:hypothetical protein
LRWRSVVFISSRLRNGIGEFHDQSTFRAGTQAFRRL